VVVRGARGACSNSATVRVLPMANVPAGVSSSAKSGVDQRTGMPLTRS
jgi:hypothetical protein